jgi:hypothetical protein
MHFIYTSLEVATLLLCPRTIEFNSIISGGCDRDIWRKITELPYKKYVAFINSSYFVPRVSHIQS